MIVISEDVWSADFEALAESFPVLREPDLWSNKDELKAKLADATALVVRNRTQVTREIIEAAPKLKVIARAGVGLDNIDIKAADDNGVVVAAALGINAVAVGEQTVLMALAISRKLIELDASTRAGEWNRKAGREITGKTWGLLGFGATARATAELLKGFKVNVLAYDPFAKPDAEYLKSINAELVTMDEVVAKSDYISIHLPATAETKDVINSALLNKMKSSVILVSVGRGEVINEADLETALRDGVIAGAGLDVRAQEPPKDQRFTDLGNVVLAPHVAGITQESQAAINQVLVSEIRAALTGGAQKYAVGAVKQAK
ncbi:MAG: hydroxyacid dehydrogenase [Candidatus Nanopelagicaceae bacterium]|nr:hydroxyacid dehydrogenase [Candidatus Nanopelagicaceae bacterium]